MCSLELKKSNITESKINTKLYRITVTRNMYSFLHSINQYVTTLQLLHHTFPQSQKHQFNTFYNYKSHSGNFRDKTSTKNILLFFAHYKLKASLGTAFFSQVVGQLGFSRNISVMTNVIAPVIFRCSSLLK